MTREREVIVEQGEGVIATRIPANAYRRLLFHLEGHTSGFVKRLYDFILAPEITPEILHSLAKVYPEEVHAVWLYRYGGVKAVRSEAEEQESKDVR